MTMLVRIDKDIRDIQQAIANVVSRIDLLHLDYAKAIAIAVQQKILLATFKFCTQKCPEAFLALSLSARQKLQEDLRQTIQLLSNNMQKTLEECDQNSRTNQENLDLLLGTSLNESMDTLNKLLSDRQILVADDKTQQMSIRLSEIEFTDRQLMSYRGELRVLSARILHLETELEKKYLQKTIAEAELAWRAAWVE